MNHELEDVEGLLREQAKRIEALEVALREIRKINEDATGAEGIEIIESIARAALAPEQDK